MPAEDVSDLRDVVDAINRLCDTMKTADYGFVEREREEEAVECEREPVEWRQELVGPEEVVVRQVETYVAEKWSETVIEEAAAAERLASTFAVERWSDTVLEEVSDTEQLVTVCEPISEYYTASSEVSLLSDEMVQVAVDDKDKIVNYASSEVSLQSDELAQFGSDDLEQRDDRNSVMAGHVAAMRERFESMTRTNTPCPDLMRSASPSFDIFRNITPSPDQLDKS